MSARRVRTLLLILAAIWLGFVSAQDIPTVARHDTLIFENIDGRVPVPGNMNPYVIGQYLHWGMWQATQESLFYYNYESGQLMPWLAESGTYSSDNTVVTIAIREGVRWSDGVPFTAEDVAFTIDMQKANPELQYSADMNRWVESVEVVDSHTVVLQLVDPNPRFLLDFFGVRIWETLLIAPKHVWEDVDPATFSNFDLERGLPLGTGPYRLVRSTETETVFDRLDSWWAAETGFQAMPAPERVIWAAAGTEDVRAAMAVNDQLDAMWILSRGTFEAAQRRNPGIVGWYDELPYAYLDPCPRYLGLNVGAAPFNDSAVRWAVNHAVDRDQLVMLAYEGMTEAAATLYPTYPALQAFLEQNAEILAQYPVIADDPDIDAIMVEAGYARDARNMWVDGEGRPVSFEIITRAGEVDKMRMGPLLAEQLQRAGFDATFRSLESAVYYTDVATGRALAYITDMCGSVADPYKTLSLFHSRWSVPVGETAPGPNASRFENAEFDALIDTMATLPADDPEFRDAASSALEIWVRELPAIPLVQARLLTPFNTTYWIGWPTADNDFVQPGHWWVTGNLLIHAVEPNPDR